MPLKHHQSDTPNHYSSKSTCQNILSWLSSYLPMRQLYLFQNLLSPKLVRVFQQQDLIKLVLQNIFKQASEGKFQLSMHQVPALAWRDSSDIPVASDALIEKSEALRPAKELSH